MHGALDSVFFASGDNARVVSRAMTFEVVELAPAENGVLFWPAAIGKGRSLMKKIAASLEASDRDDSQIEQLREQLRGEPHFRVMPITTAAAREIRASNAFVRQQFKISVHQSVDGQARGSAESADPNVVELSVAKSIVRKHLKEVYGIVFRKSDGTTSEIKTADALLKVGDKAQTPWHEPLIFELSRAITAAGRLEAGMGEEFAWPKNG